MKRLLSCACAFLLAVTLVPAAAFNVPASSVAFAEIAVDAEDMDGAYPVSQDSLDEVSSDIFAGGVITDFDSLADDVRYQRGAAPELPETVKATVKAADNSSSTIPVPVTWNAKDYTPGSAGLYVFIAQPEEGYTLASDLEAPRITAFITEAVPAASRMLRATAGRVLGLGAEQSPLQLTNADQLAEVAALVNAGQLESFVFGNASTKIYLRLMNDLDLSAYGTINSSFNNGEGWAPIGAEGNSFKGVFDGDGHVITGLSINRATFYAGLFGYADGAQIKNLGLEGVSVKNTGSYAGGLVGHAEFSAIADCYVTGFVSGGEYYAGGLAGTASCSTIEGCYTTASVSGNHYVGGLVGYAVVNYTIADCYATGSISGTGAYVGGLMGWAGYSDKGFFSSVTDCYATGVVSGSNCVGGLAGFTLNAATTISGCLALNPSVTASSSDGYIGRVVGENEGGKATLSGNYAFSGMTVKIDGVDKPITEGQGNAVATDIDGLGKTAAELQEAAGFPAAFTSSPWAYEPGSLPGLNGKTVNMPTHLQIAPAHSPGSSTETGDMPAHLLSELFPGSGTEDDPYRIYTAAHLAKMAEFVNAGTAPYADEDVYYVLENDIDLSDYGTNNQEFNEGKGWAPIGTDYIKFFKGYFDGKGHTITGLSINTTDDYAGLFGYVNGVEIKNLGVEGAIVKSTQNNVGGLVSYAYASSVTACYTTGIVSGAGGVGGIAGYMAESSVITACYATTAVSGNSRVGGLVGESTTGSDITNCYATGAVSGSGGVIGGLVGYSTKSSS
ncbi:MAG: hypothetical protein LBC58_06115, partial [Clostridiales Family XIII bacterium]|nr:hypothetical protein [Clostridiales Family XIII bacterium]